MCVTSSTGFAQGLPAGSLHVGFDLGIVDYNQLGEATSAGQMFIGYQVNDIWGVDLGWNDLGDPKTLDDLRADTDGVALRLYAQLPFQDYLSLFSRIGVLSWDSQLSEVGRSFEDSGSDLTVGAGVQTNFYSEALIIRGSFDAFKSGYGNGETENILKYSVALLFHF